MGTTRNVDMSANQGPIKVVEAANEDGTTPSATAKPKKQRVRSKRYQDARSQVDKTKLYDPFAAIELVKQLTYATFDASIEAHVVLRETGATATLTFPHSTGKSVNVAIATDELLKEIEAGTINFDVLVATKDMMAKLTKHARVLGPRGLMPNPKNGTLTEDPEKKKKQLEAGSLTLKTEKKAPLIHVVIGKTSMSTKELLENLEALTKAFKGKVVKLAICSTMSPGVKVQLG